MPTERSAGAIIFRKEKGSIYYLVLHYEVGHWDFVKGKIEDDEEMKQTIIRETEEEAGINDLEFINEFEEKIEYFFKRNNKTIFKIVIFFLAETKIGKVKLSHEHIDFKWLNYEQALNKLTFDNAKNVLKKANELIKL
ncbi:MAG: bis(5'-nucleosyl)-tetraphosphatase [Patescibacteria group bacterium]|nr:bis(5'-nucleosyl)-tetraphosphatase [Patescibacteria group bacterium]